MEEEIKEFLQRTSKWMINNRTLNFHLFQNQLFQKLTQLKSQINIYHQLIQLYLHSQANIEVKISFFIKITVPYQFIVNQLWLFKTLVKVTKTAKLFLKACKNSKMEELVNIFKQEMKTTLISLFKIKMTTIFRCYHPRHGIC